MRVLRIVAVAAALSFVGAPMAHALPPIGDPGAGNTGFTVLGGYDGSWLHYRETDSSGNVLDRDYGWLNGLDIEARFENRVLWTRLSADYLWSHDATYDGAICSSAGCVPAKFSASERIALYEADIGLKLLNVKTGTLTPYAGIGRRIWWRGVDGEKYSWYYAAIGLNYVWRTGKLTAGADVAAALPFNMKLTTSVDGSYDAATFRLRDALGVEVEVPFTYDVHKEYPDRGRVFLFLTPYYQHWGIKASDPVWMTSKGVPVAGEARYEPDSTANLYGIRVGLGVNF